MEARPAWTLSLGLRGDVVVVVQSLNYVRLFATPRTAARQVWSCPEPVSELMAWGSPACGRPLAPNPQPLRRRQTLLTPACTPRGMGSGFLLWLFAGVGTTASLRFP